MDITDRDANRCVMGMRWVGDPDRVTSKQRLGKLRERAGSLSITWRDVRYERHHVPPHPTHRKNEHGESVMFLDYLAIGENMGSSYDIMSKEYGHRNYPLGYYVDGYADETLTGYVVKIRTPQGTLYVPMTACSSWDGVTYYMSEGHLVEKGCGTDEESHEQAMTEVARTADSIAEREAEEARDYWLKEEAEYQISETRNEIKGLAKTMRKRFQAIRELQAQSRADMFRECREIKELAERIEKLKDAPWEILLH